MSNRRNTYLQLVSTIIFFNILIYASVPAAAQDSSSITIPYSAHHTPESPNFYYEEALKLALAKTEPAYGKINLKFYPFATGRDRQSAILKTNGGLDLIWDSSSQLREVNMLAIKFNLLRELSDYKILVIRKEDKEKFATVRRLSDLRKFKAGTVSEWQDTKILQLNSMPYIAYAEPEQLFKMLTSKRVNYTMRGPQEIWPELEQHQDLLLIAEEKLLIRYKRPVYFFVHPKNAKLAERIKKGLALAEKDGSLKKLFMSLPAFKKGLEEITKKQKTVINLDEGDGFE